MQKIAFTLFKLFSYCLAVLPLRLQYFIAWIFYLKLYFIFRYRRKVVRNNLKNSFPLKSKNEILKLEKTFYRYFAELFIEINALTRLKKKELSKRFTVKNPDVLSKYFHEGKSIVAVMGHYGNWEWFSFLPQLIEHKVLAIYKPLLNPQFDRFFKNIRERFGTETVPMAAIYKTLLGYHKSQTPVMTLFIADQSPKRSDIRYWAKFLNQDTALFLGPEKIAQKLNQVVVFIKVRRSGRGFYELEFIPLSEKPKELSEREITLLHVKELEKMIEEEPAFWLWTHKRWKHKPPQKKEND